MKTDSVDIPFGHFGEYPVVYNCVDCRQSQSGTINFYYIRKNEKRLLFAQKIGDFYVTEVSHVKIKNENFIYIGSSHTFGHSQGYLIFLNDKTMRAYEIEVRKSGLNLPNHVTIHKYFDLTKDAKNYLAFSATTKSE